MGPSVQNVCRRPLNLEYQPCELKNNTKKPQMNENQKGRKKITSLRRADVIKLAEFLCQRKKKESITN
uniref:Uncharacterized protein LOC104217550 n=1 Tax=Nicotiana sylvestris TaxID=4096 RepID=A0A1U7VUN4_NICSY|nr:PREDICTED: uncharacterized protein LOC104217550 [Nicotiana sylvestris]